MPRIIKKAKRKEYQVVCHNCEYTIGYFKDDVKEYHSGSDPWGYSEDYEYITCPHCKKRIVTKSL